MEDKNLRKDRKDGENFINKRHGLPSTESQKKKKLLAYERNKRVEQLLESIKRKRFRPKKKEEMS